MDEVDVQEQINLGARLLKRKSREVNIGERGIAAFTCKDSREVKQITRELWPRLTEALAESIENGLEDDFNEIQDFMAQVQEYLSSIASYNRIEAPINRLPRLISSFKDTDCSLYFRFRSTNDLHLLKNALFPEAQDAGQWAKVVISKSHHTANHAYGLSQPAPNFVNIFLLQFGHFTFTTSTVIFQDLIIIIVAMNSTTVNSLFAHLIY